MARLFGVSPRERLVRADILRRLAARRRQLDADVYAPALEPCLDQPARVELEHRERGRKAERDVEVAMVDRAYLDGDGDGIADGLGAAEPGHAPDHEADPAPAAGTVIDR